MSAEPLPRLAGRDTVRIAGPATVAPPSADKLPPVVSPLPKTPPPPVQDDVSVGVVQEEKKNGQEVDICE